MFTSKRTLSFQVSFPAFHLARFSCKSVPGVLSLSPTWHGFSAKAFQVSFPCRPPGTVSLQKRSRCLFLLSTWHGFPAKVYQVSLPAVHLPRFLCKSVPGVSFCCPPGTEIPRKRVRWETSSSWDAVGGSSRAYGCFQHEACSRLHTCSPGIYASF